MVSADLIGAALDDDGVASMLVVSGFPGCWDAWIVLMVF
jgi:hypothetical protein